MAPTCDAIIPARGGSKGIPGKNLRRVGGRSLIARAVETARGAAGIRRVYVSTDDAAIAAAAREAGAEVIERPAEIAGDTASSEAALLHALDRLEERGALPDLLCFVQCTSPLTASEDIAGALERFLREGADSLLSAGRTHGFLWRQGGDGQALGVNHDPAFRPRRQDREPEYLESGAFYLLRVAGFRQARHRFFGRVLLHEMPPERIWEIDEPADLAVAEALLAAGAGAGALPARPAGLVLDFDGVMTDNLALVDETGRESVRVNRSDGLGLERLRASGLPILVLSKEKNPVVTARARKLKLEVLQGIDAKLPALRDWAAAKGLALADLVYVGNDDNDVECLAAVGCGVAVADAYPAARAAARLVLQRAGGQGAVREVCDLLHARLEQPLRR